MCVYVCMRVYVGGGGLGWVSPDSPVLGEMAELEHDAVRVGPVHAVALVVVEERLPALQPVVGRVGESVGPSRLRIEGPREEM